jgi:hypothetical protein
MRTVQMIDFSSAKIGEISIEPRQGRLMIRTYDTAFYGWDASAELRGVNLSLNRLMTSREVVGVEFETRLSGQAFVSNQRESSSQGLVRTFLRLQGTGPLEGLEVEEG